MLDKLRKKINNLTFRIYILKVVCIGLLFLLSYRLYQMQVIYTSDYVAWLDRTSSTRVSVNVPRGRVYDRNMNILIDNDAVPIITYEFSTAVGRTAMWEMAYVVAELLQRVDETGQRTADMISGLRTRDLQDLWLGLNPEKAREMIEPGHGLDDEGFYRRQLELLSENEEWLDSLTEREKYAQVIFNNMNQGINGDINIVKNGASREELFIIGENLPHLRGFDIGTSWNRVWPSEMGQSNIFGLVTTYEQGLPSDQAERLRALGYRNNDRVGRSQLEAALEPFLRGNNYQFEVINENDNPSRNLIFEGSPGMDVTLTLDLELQNRVNDILFENLVRSRTQLPTSRHLSEGYIVLLNPNTGEILSMNGMGIYRDEDGQWAFAENALGTVQLAFEMGSTVKGASMLMGYDQGTTSIGQVRFDRELQFRGSNPMSSWRNMGNVSDLDALMYSSNVFFWLQTIQMTGNSYTPNGPLLLNTPGNSGSGPQSYLEWFAAHRNFFNEFGLGASTGIEIPEAAGQRIPNPSPHDLLFFTIGQSDTYTTMQLAQYAMTLANGGYRFATQLIGDVFHHITEDGEPRLHRPFTPQLLNRIDMDQRYFDRVREGFRRGVQDSRGTGFGAFSGSSYNPAGKTGTAQTLLLDDNGIPVRPAVSVHNVTFVGWAPVENPEVSVAVILPAGEIPGMTPGNTTAQIIAREAMEAFFELRASR